MTGETGSLTKKDLKATLGCTLSVTLKYEVLEMGKETGEKDLEQEQKARSRLSSSRVE